MLNKQLFDRDPTTYAIPNDGVSKVTQLPESPETEDERRLWAVAKYECESFVCDGSYHEGLRRILEAYLKNLSQPTQKAVWVHGFYGCGKSHLVRILQFLWSDVQFPDGSTARGLVTVPQDISDALRELTQASKSRGGLWSAADAMSSSGGNDARAAILGVVLKAAGLPERINQAQFDIWVREAGWYEAICAGLAEDKRDYRTEVNHLFVSPWLARQLMSACPEFASSEQDALTKIQAQFPDVRTVSTDLMISMMRRVLDLKSERKGKLPCTLLVLDELQQYIGDSDQRTTSVQDAVEACVSEFGSAVLLVGTGQSALQATPLLSKLTDRFTIPVELKDDDVEKVLQQTVLLKSPQGTSAINQALEGCAGEIDRHFGGTKLAGAAGDAARLAPDYPLLPTRRRFWEAVMRAVRAGTAGQLRTQLRLAFEAAQATADDPVGNVIGADYVYTQQRGSFVQNATLLREIDETIQRLDDGTPDGRLRSRICATVWLIGLLPEDVGLRATADSIADALVTELPAGSAGMRQRVQEMLKELEQAGGGHEQKAAVLVCTNGAYRMQTAEGAEWDLEYRQKLAQLRSDTAAIGRDRDEAISAAIKSAAGKIKLMQGESKMPRSLEVTFGDEPPSQTNHVPVWVQTGWDASEAEGRKAAAQAKTESPVVFVFVPRQDDEDIRANLAGKRAASTVLDQKGEPGTDGGRVARAGIRNRLENHTETVAELVNRAVDSAKIFQGGGTEVAQQIDFQAALDFAAKASLTRLFPRFKDADSSDWAKVINKARNGDPNPLEAIRHTGAPEQHPVCKALLEQLGVGASKGVDLRRQFAAPPFGWGRDAVDGALFALLASGLVKATKSGATVAATQLDQIKLQQTEFRAETSVITTQQRLAIRKLISSAGIACVSGEEAVKAPLLLQRLKELADGAGGDAPLPPRPPTAHIVEMEPLSGNELVLKLFEERERLDADRTRWQELGELARKRRPSWERLRELMKHADGLPVHADAAQQAAALESNRLLLSDPDPVAPLIQSLVTALRDAVNAARQKHLESFGGLDDLLNSDTWKKLPEQKQREILQRHQLGPVPELKAGTEDELMEELRQRPIRSWEDRTAAIGARVAQAMLDAERELQPAARPFSVPKRKVANEQELDAYLTEVREKVIEIIQQGNPVVLS